MTYGNNNYYNYNQESVAESMIMSYMYKHQGTEYNYNEVINKAD